MEEELKYRIECTFQRAKNAKERRKIECLKEMLEENNRLRIFKKGKKSNRERKCREKRRKVERKERERKPVS